MDLKIGDLVVFKKYDDMDGEAKMGIQKESFPEFGKVTEVYGAIDCFKTEEEPYTFSTESIDYITSNNNVDEIHKGDKLLIKAIAEEVRDNHVWISWISKDNVIKVLNRKNEHFILQENYYGMYVTDSKSLSLGKSKAKIYDSRDETNEAAADMNLDSWNVITYDNER